MTKTILSSRPVALLAGTALFSAAGLAACAYQEPARPVGYRPVPVQTTVVVQDDYVYYPQYEVYYSSSRHQYGYRDGNAWAWRPAPANVSLNVMLSSPSVHMDFHDSPERHHAAVVKSYPKNWHAPAAKQSKDDHQKDKKDDGKDSNRDH
jgi:hypothetical protein